MGDKREFVKHTLFAVAREVAQEYNRDPLSDRSH